MAFSGPNALPSYVQGHSTSSTSIFVQWSNVPATDQNGALLSYTVICKGLPDGSPTTKVVSAPTTNVTLTGLNEYTNYSITVFASTVKEDGNVSEHVPTADQNGVILSYTVTFEASPDGSPQTKVVSAPRTQATLTGLNEYTNYSITVFPSTVKGDGRRNSALIIVVTEQDSKLTSTGKFFVWGKSNSQLRFCDSIDSCTSSEIFSNSYSVFLL